MASPQLLESFHKDLTALAGSIRRIAVAGAKAAAADKAKTRLTGIKFLLVDLKGKRMAALETAAAFSSGALSDFVAALPPLTGKHAEAKRAAVAAVIARKAQALRKELQAIGVLLDLWDGMLTATGDAVNRARLDAAAALKKARAGKIPSKGKTGPAVTIAGTVIEASEEMLRACQKEIDAIAKAVSAQARELADARRAHEKRLQAFEALFRRVQDFKP